jgi:hypothetical protein
MGCRGNVVTLQILWCYDDLGVGVIVSGAEGQLGNRLVYDLSSASRMCVTC